MYSVALSGRLVQALAERGVHLSLPCQRNLAMLCVGLALGRDCHLDTLVTWLPLNGRRDSLIQHLRRGLRHAPSWRLAYQPLVERLLANWPGAEICLVMDRTDLAHRTSILTLGLAYGQRTLPLAWQVRSFGGTGAVNQIALLDRVAPLLPAGKPVTFLGDAKFRAVDVRLYCREHGWHWHVGLKSDLLIQTAALSLSPYSGPIYRQNVLLTGNHSFGPVNILARWAAKDDCGRYWATDRPADRHTWRRGRRRFWIEPTFRDWKSYGFDLEGSRLTDHHTSEALSGPYPGGPTHVTTRPTAERLLHAFRKTTMLVARMPDQTIHYTTPLSEPQRRILRLPELLLHHQGRRFRHAKLQSLCRPR